MKDSAESTRPLTRKEASDFLTAHGFRVATGTLAKYACIGGGPVFQSFGRRALYRAADLLDWAKSKSTGPRRSTSDPA